MQVRVVRHVPFEHLGRIAPVLAAHSIAFEYKDFHENPAASLELAALDGLIVMGGPQSANDPLPYIRHESALLERAIAAGLPVLGICLGSQLIARTLGARVRRNPVKEIGWFDVSWEPAAAGDRLFSEFHTPETVFHWHGETFDLPAGAVHLASSEACRNQAFRYGTSVYGLQFHLEVTPEMIDGWCREDANCGDVRELETPLDPFHNAARLAEISDAVFSRWAGLVQEYAATHQTPGSSR